MTAPYEATNVYPGTGVQVDFPVTFSGGYLRPQDLLVWVVHEGVTTVPSWAFISNTVVRVVPTPPPDSLVYFRRHTPATPLVSFSDGSLVNGKNLDLAAKQALFVATEARDGVASYTARIEALESPPPALYCEAGENLSVGMVLRLNADGRLYRWYGSDSTPVGLCTSNSSLGESVGVLEHGEFDGGWAFPPGSRLFVGVDSYPTTTIPTEGVLCEVGIGWPGRIYFQPESPVRLS